jgi:hypothetical protein
VAFGQGGWVQHYGSTHTRPCGLPWDWDESADVDGRFKPMFEMARLVARGTSCDLPGVPMKYDSFVTAMWTAVKSGHVDGTKAQFIQNALQYGVEGGARREQLAGHRVFSNYPAATGEFAVKVAKAIAKRVQSGRTLDLGPWSEDLRGVMKRVFKWFYIFPLSARAKPLEPNDARPISDHTRTGFNAAVDLTGLMHTLDAVQEIESLLKPGYCMHVSDVDAAYPMLAWASWIWAAMFHRFYPMNEDGTLGQKLHLYVNINGDFGTRGMPGVFKIFFTDVVVNMARSYGVLSLPMPIFVDDMGAIGALAKSARKEMLRFQEWTSETCGVNFKQIKDKHASQVQLMLGFWWDSFAGTRSLEERRLISYLDMLWDFSSRRSLSLNERQSIAGKMQRAAMTMPTGAACLLAGLFGLMCGLKLGWQKRRTTREERQNYRYFHDILKMNVGTGHYDNSRFEKGPDVQSDASRQQKYSGGGWCCSTGAYHWFSYGVSAARKPIDFLEGDTVVDAVERLGHEWSGKWIPFGVDNQAFQKSAAKGWSKAERLTLLLKRLFVLQIKFNCLLCFYWLASEENVLADHLSRGRIEEFFAAAAYSVFFEAGVALVPQHDAGRKRNLDMSAPFNREDMAMLRAHRKPQPDMAELSRQVVAAVSLQAMARGWLARRCNRNDKPATAATETPISESVQSNESSAASTPSVASNADGAIKSGKGGRASRRVGGNVRRALLLTTAMLGLVHAAPQTRGMSEQMGSVTYPRATLYEGLPGHLLGKLDELLDNLLSSSSVRTMNVAVKMWQAVALYNDWDEVIQTDDPHRGGKLVTFVLHMLTNTELVAESISTYVWGMRWWQKLQRQADPVMGVMHWHDFMTSVRVVAHVPHEPRRAIPMGLVKAMLETVREDSFWEVQWAFIMLIFLFTFSRTECPCPKNFSGEESWDDNKHWMVRDIKVKLVQGTWALAVRFKAIKQDPRIERPEARGDGSEPGSSLEGGADWAYVGDVPNTIWSVFGWYAKLMKFYDGPRDPTAPFFMAKDRVRPYTYTALTRDLKVMLRRVGTDTDYGPHGMRVEGYNQCKASSGLDIAVAQGLWQPGSNTRYDRFSVVRDILPLAARMTGEAPQVREPSTLPRQIVRNGGSARHDDTLSDEVEPAPHGPTLVAEAAQRVLLRETANPANHHMFLDSDFRWVDDDDDNGDALGEAEGPGDGGDDGDAADVEPAVPAGATSSTRSPIEPRRSARCASSSSSS